MIYGGLIKRKAIAIKHLDMVVILIEVIRNAKTIQLCYLFC